MIWLLDKGAMRVLTVFSLSPGSRLNRQSLKKQSMLSNVILNKTLNKLVNTSILIKGKNLFALNLASHDTNDIMKEVSNNYSNFRRLPLKEYFMLVDIIAEFMKLKGIGDVYLFGSYAKLVFRESSDIDLAFVSDNIQEKPLERIAAKLEKKYGKRIEIHTFSSKFYRSKRDPLVREILRDGIRIV